MANKNSKKGLVSLIITWVLIVLLAAGTIGTVWYYKTNNSELLNSDELAEKLAEKLGKSAGKITKEDLASIEGVDIVFDGMYITIDEAGNYIPVETNSVELRLAGYEEAEKAYNAEGVTEEQKKTMKNPQDLFLSVNITDSAVIDDIKLFTGVKSVGIYDYNPDKGTCTFDVKDIADFKNITSLHMIGTKIKNFEKVNTFKNLTSFAVESDSVKDMNFVKDFTKLETLVIASENITDASAIEELTSLKNLTINGCNLDKLPSFEKLTALENVNLQSNKIKDISALSVLDNEKIISLDIRNNEIEDYSPIDGLDADKVQSDKEPEPAEEETTEGAETTTTDTESEEVKDATASDSEKDAITEADNESTAA